MISITTTLLFSVSILVITVLWKKCWLYIRRVRVLLKMPGPKYYPFIGTANYFQDVKYENMLFAEMALMKKYNYSPNCIWTGLNGIVFISKAQHIELNLGDHTSSVWATCFADEAEKFLGKTSEEIGEMYESDKTALNDFFTTKTFSKVLVKLRVKMEGYQDEQRFKSVIMKTENSEADVFRCLLERLQKSAGLETSVLKQLKH